MGRYSRKVGELFFLMADPGWWLHEETRDGRNMNIAVKDCVASRNHTEGRGWGGRGWYVYGPGKEDEIGPYKSMREAMETAARRYDSPAHIDKRREAPEAGFGDTPEEARMEPRPDCACETCGGDPRGMRVEGHWTDCTDCVSPQGEQEES